MIIEFLHRWKSRKKYTLIGLFFGDYFGWEKQWIRIGNYPGKSPLGIERTKQLFK